jgi:hypothetical protein
VNGEADGAKNITVNGTDAAGNAGTTSTMTSAFAVDNTVPVISSVTTTPGCNNAGDVINITFDITDAGCGTPQDVILTGLPGGNGELAGPTITGDAPYHYAYTYTIGNADAEGSYTVTVNAKDGAGNAAAPVNATTPFTIDNTIPTITAVSLSSPSCVNAGTDKIVFSFQAYDDGCGTFDISNFTGTEAISVAGGANLADAGTLAITSGTGISTDPYNMTLTFDIAAGDATGQYKAGISYTDNAGNNAGYSAGSNYYFSVDNSNPEIFGQTFSTACVKEGGEFDFSVYILEVGCGTMDAANVSIDGLPTGGVLSAPTITAGESENTYNFAYTYTVGSTTPDGSYTLSINVTDDAGNSLESPNTQVIINVDKTAPEISAITLDKSCVKVGDVVAVSFTVTEAGTGNCSFSPNIVTVSGYDGCQVIL